MWCKATNRREDLCHYHFRDSGQQATCELLKNQIWSLNTSSGRPKPRSTIDKQPSVNSKWWQEGALMLPILLKARRLPNRLKCHGVLPLHGLEQSRFYPGIAQAAVIAPAESSKIVSTNDLILFLTI